MRHDNNTLLYLILGGAAAFGVWYYWNNYRNNPATPGTTGLNQAISQDLAYYQAWNQAQAAGAPGSQPNGQNPGPSKVGPPNTMPPVGLAPGTTTVNGQALSLPVNA